MCVVALGGLNYDLDKTSKSESEVCTLIQRLFLYEGRKGVGNSKLWATSHMRLRARDHHHTSSTLIGGKGGVGPKFNLHTTLEGPSGVYICECKVDVQSMRVPTWQQIDHFHGHLDCFQKSSLGGRPNTKPSYPTDFVGLTSSDSELGNPGKSGKPQLPCSQRLRSHGLTSSDLGLGNPGKSGKPQLPCSQRLRSHKLTSSDLELGSLGKVVSPNFHALNG